MSKRVIILGSAGSIGENTLRVVSSLPGRYTVVGLAVNRSYARMLEQAKQYGVQHVAVADVESAERCRAEAPAGMVVHGGVDGVDCLVKTVDADVVVCAVVGIAGLRPVMAALEKGTDVAIATKEVLVAAGGIVRRIAARTGAKLLPVDSEHSAIFQCLAAHQGNAAVQRLLLTASGGPFFADPSVDFSRVTARDALKHPTWDMGKKVTIDSATLMNKGLEIMEAHWLFDVPLDRIDVVVHPESIIHSMVEFVDGSVLAQMSVPDMRFAIQYALTFPERFPGGLPTLDLAQIGTLRFYPPDEKRFPCLRLAREAARRGGTAPAALNAANEVAVDRFLTGRIRFAGIWELVESVLSRHEGVQEPELDDIIAADEWGRWQAAKLAD
jgi:1-deoxy-D-xylulose-5-phosphate reductoisomerase